MPRRKGSVTLALTDQLRKMACADRSSGTRWMPRSTAVAGSAGR